MFGWLKTQVSNPFSEKSAGKFESKQKHFAFKDAFSAVEIASKYMDCTLEKGRALPAVVLDAREHFSAEQEVSVRNDGIQLPVLRVASDDGGFIVMASTAGPKGPKLSPGDLVAWTPLSFNQKLAGVSDDSRLGWMGVVNAKLKPEHTGQEWVLDKNFQ